MFEPLSLYLKYLYSNTLNIQSYLVRIGVKEAPFTSPGVRLVRVLFSHLYIHQVFTRFLE